MSVPTSPPAPIPYAHAGPGGRIAGDLWPGAGTGAPVVMLHGGGQTRHSWARTAARLAAGGRTVLTLDARGHGDSDWVPDGDYSMDGFVADLRSVLTTLPTPPVLVGASLGGMTSLLTAGEHPGCATGLVLVDVAVRIERSGVERIHAFLTDRPDGFASLEEVADAIATYNPHRPRPQNLDGLRKNVRQRDDGRWYWHWDPAFIELTDEARREERLQRLEDAARALTIPVLLVRGGSSDVVTPEGAEHLLQLVPTATSVDVSGTGHMLVGDDNDVFSATLESFLLRADGSGD